MKKRPEYTDLKKSLKISVSEGVSSQVFTSLGGPGSVFLTKFAVMLGATPFQFGILAAIGQLSQLFQPLGVALTRRSKERKPVTLKLLSVGRTIVLLFGILPFFLPKNIAIWAFLGLFLVSSSFNAAGLNTWIAWISDLFPLRIRGRFLSRRSQFLLIAALITGYLFGAFVDMFDPNPGAIAIWLDNLLGIAVEGLTEFQPYAQAFVFAMAAVAGIIGVLILRKQPERPKNVESESIAQILIYPLKDPNFRRLLIYGLWWMLAIGIGAPFWQPFMIKKLGMSIVYIQIYGTISVIASLASLRLWGLFIDKYGNKTAMRFAIILGGLNPLVWLLATPDRFWIVYLEAALSGVMWSGANIVAVNLVLSIAPKERKQAYSGVFGAFSGVAMMTTMMLSGIFLPKALDFGGFHLEPEQVLFGITGIARWTTQIPLTWIEEPGAVPVRDTIYMLQETAKVRIARMTEWFTGRNRR